MNILDTVLGLVAPDECVGCQREGNPLCMECSDKLLTLPATICFLCGKLSRGYKTCDKCQCTYKPGHVWISASYEGLAKELVKVYKFSWNRRAAKTMAGFLDETLPYFAESPLVTFVPTAPSHVRERGFDHAGLIAKELARLRGWHYAPLLVRQKSLQQHGAKRIDRIKQIQGAFRVQNDKLLASNHILLVDDVVTTGATISECTKMLKKAGATRVDAAVFARTPKN